MQATRVYNDEFGETHFGLVSIAGEKLDDGFLSEKMHPTSMEFYSTGESADIDWHTAPQRLYIVLLKGQVQIKVSDGEKRLFEAGNILLMEDTEGKGHKSSSPDGKGRSALMICLDYF